MRLPTILLALSIALLIGCGSDSGSTTGSADAGNVESGGQGPSGELREDGIGSVDVGSSTSQVEQVFGKPDREQQLPGCELDGPNATPTLQWTWNLADGAVTVDFDAASGQLISYRTTSPSLPTDAGVRIGDTFDTLRQGYGLILKPLNIGAKSSPSSGVWYVGKPGHTWLLFSVAGGTIKTIQGGNVQVCE